MMSLESETSQLRDTFSSNYLPALKQRYDNLRTSTLYVNIFGFRNILEGMKRLRT